MGSGDAGEANLAAGAWVDPGAKRMSQPGASQGIKPSNRTLHLTTVCSDCSLSAHLFPALTVSAIATVASVVGSVGYDHDYDGSQVLTDKNSSLSLLLFDHTVAGLLSVSIRALLKALLC